MSDLAALYVSQGRYDEAEPLYREALQLSREVLGERHPDTLGIMNNLAALYQSQGRYGEAEPLYTEVLQFAARYSVRAILTRWPASATWRGYIRTRVVMARPNRFTSKRCSCAARCWAHAIPTRCRA